MPTTQLNNAQNGHSKAITDINQVTKSNEIFEPIDKIYFLLKDRTTDPDADRNNILEACKLIFKQYKSGDLAVVNKKYFTTEVECCYCGLKNDAKFNISQVKNYINLNVRCIPKLFVIDCHNADCPGNIALKNKWRSIRVKSTWRPTDGTWRTRPPKYTYTTKSKKKSTIPVENAAPQLNAMSTSLEISTIQPQNKLTVDCQIQEKIQGQHSDLLPFPDKVNTGKYSFHVNRNCYQATVKFLEMAVREKWMAIINCANITETGLIEQMQSLQGVCCIISDVHETYSTTPYTPELKAQFEKLPRFDASRIESETKAEQSIYLPRLVQLNSNPGNIDHNKQAVFFAPRVSNSNTTGSMSILDKLKANVNQFDSYYPVVYSHGSMNLTKQGSGNGDSWQVNDARDESFIELVNVMKEVLITKATIAQILVD
jgi:hypothetical protein